MTDGNQYPHIELDSTCFINESNDNIIGLSKIMYAELEKLIEKYGKESFRQLVIIVENTFESLFEAYRLKSGILCDLEELKHDHAMLQSRYQIEKNEMKAFKERAFELDDSLQEKIKEIECLKSQLSLTEKIYEMKMKNLKDHSTRIEDLEKIHQANHASLQSRYERLLAAHMELSERLKMSNDLGVSKVANDVEEMGHNIPASSTRSKLMLSADLEPTSSTCTVTSPLLLVSHKGDSPYEWGVHHRLHDDSFGEIALDADGSPFLRLSADENCEDISNSEDKSENGDLGGRSSPVASMQTDGNTNNFDAIKEINKLVNEINEKETRINALNFVINDLATRLEEVDIEKEQLKETLSQMQICRSSMQLRIKQVEEENVRLRADLSELMKMQKEMALNETPLSRKRNFTREEMAKVLMDRIQLQEDYADLRERYSTIINSERRCAYDKSEAGSGAFMLFFSRLFKRPSRKPPLRVSFDTTTSGISMDFNATRLFDAETESPARERRIASADSVNVSSCSRGWWIPVPIIGKSCAPEPVVMQNSAALRERNLSSQQVPSRVNPSSPLPQHLYLRPIPEALSLQMRLICSTCLYSDVGGLLPSGEVMAGQSTFFDPSAADRYSSTYSTCESLSSQLWMCLVGVLDTPVVTTVNVNNNSSTSNSLGKLASSAPFSPSGVKVESRPSFRSQIVVVDANKPSRYVDSFCLQRAVVTCMTAVPGAKGRDYEVLRLSNATWESIPFATPSENVDSQQSIGAASATNHLDTSQPPPSTSQPEDYEDEDEDGPASIQTNNTLSSLRHFVETVGKDSEALLKVLQNQQTRQKSSAQLSLESSSTTAAGLSQRTSAFEPDLSLQLGGKTGDFYRVERQKFKNIANSTQLNVFGNGSNMISSASAQQTVWIGCQNGDIFIHSCDSSQRRPLQSTRLPAGVTSIRHFSGRVFVSLSDGHIVVFRRQVRHPIDQSAKNPGGSLLQPRTSSPISHVSSTSQNYQLSIGEELAEAATAAGAWDLSEAVVIRCALTTQSLVKSMVIVPTTLTLWVGNRNRVLVIDTTTFQRLYAFEVEPKSSHTVRQLCWCRDGVWISLRDDHTLRLFNVFTYEPMQTVDMAYIINETVDAGAYDSHLLTVSASVTALEASADHLWIGTKGGHVACIPFKQDSSSKQTYNQSDASQNSNVSDFTNATSVKNENFQEVAPPSSHLDLSRASVSGYGHTETVSFFSLVGGNPALHNNSSAPHSMQQPLSNDGLLMVSGGVGLVERQKSIPSITRTHDTEKFVSKSQSHLLVWSLSSAESKAV